VCPLVAGRTSPDDIKGQAQVLFAKDKEESLLQTAWVAIIWGKKVLTVGALKH